MSNLCVIPNFNLWLIKESNYISDWDKDSVSNEAAKFDTLSDFKKNSPDAFEYAKSHHLLDELFGETKRKKKENN